eukprot:2829570-Rhodomonas_salina.1
MGHDKCSEQLVFSQKKATDVGGGGGWRCDVLDARVVLEALVTVHVLPVSSVRAVDARVSAGHLLVRGVHERKRMNTHRRVASRFWNSLCRCSQGKILLSLEASSDSR